MVSAHCDQAIIPVNFDGIRRDMIRKLHFSGSHQSTQGLKSAQVCGRDVRAQARIPCKAQYQHSIFEFRVRLCMPAASEVGPNFATRLWSSVVSITNHSHATASSSFQNLFTDSPSSLDLSNKTSEVNFCLYSSTICNRCPAPDIHPFAVCSCSK